jgi:hypothetical protein
MPELPISGDWLDKYRVQLFRLVHPDATSIEAGAAACVGGRPSSVSSWARCRVSAAESC